MPGLVSEEDELTRSEIRSEVTDEGADLLAGLLLGLWSPVVNWPRLASSGPNLRPTMGPGEGSTMAFSRLTRASARAYVAPVAQVSLRPYGG